MSSLLTWPDRVFSAIICNKITSQNSFVVALGSVALITVVSNNGIGPTSILFIRCNFHFTLKWSWCKDCFSPLGDMTRHRNCFLVSSICINGKIVFRFCQFVLMEKLFFALMIALGTKIGFRFVCPRQFLEKTMFFLQNDLSSRSQLCS